jgi:hypothetical protein
MLAPLAAIALWIGVWPRTAIDIIDKPVGEWCRAMEGGKEVGKLPGGGK